MTEIHGNTSGLSPDAIRHLERLYRRRVPASSIYTPELLRSLLDATLLVHRQVGVLVHRNGSVEYVVVGDANRLMLPDLGRHRAAEGRFRGLRLIKTHVHGEAVTKDDLVDLVRLRLDLVCALALAPSGDLRNVSYAYNVPGIPGELPYRLLGPMLPGQVSLDVGALMLDLEAELGRRRKSRAVRGKDGRAILLHVASSSEGARGGRSPSKAELTHEAQSSLIELRELARTAGVEVVDSELQIRDRLDAKLVLGKGKLESVILRAAELDADVLVFDHNLSPAQAAAVASLSDMKVIDRTQLILDIFAQRATSRDGKLQVELAQLKYSLPRLGAKDDALSRLSGGIGGRGPGETKLEIGRRRAKERVAHLESQLEHLAKQRAERRRHRERGQVPTVAIVGYTNAGKSTLLRALTGAEVLVEDKLFATLETRSRTLRVGWAGHGGREVVLTDTVGFIRNLPKDLFAAFRATFEEAQGADLLLHVLDASDPAWRSHVDTTLVLLEELELSHIPRLTVFNKCELLSEADVRRLRHADASAFTVSALDRDSLAPLVEGLAEALGERWLDAATAPPRHLQQRIDQEVDGG